MQLKRHHKGDPECLLLPLNACTWADGETPLERRGVDGGLVWELVHEVQEYRNRAIESARHQQRASNHFDHVPWPEWPSEMEGELNARSFVRRHLLEWTRPICAPLFARVPQEARGVPTTFLSYAWDATLLAQGYGVIQAIEPYLGDGEFIWMDIFCHNQHDVGSVADQMDAVIANVERLVLPMSEPPWYKRAWCIWEVLCAYRRGKPVELCEYARKLRNMYQIRDYFLSGFTSIHDAETTLPEDKVLILQCAKDAFGSVPAADDWLRAMMGKTIGST